MMWKTSWFYLVCFVCLFGFYFIDVISFLVFLPIPCLPFFPPFILLYSWSTSSSYASWSHRISSQASARKWSIRNSSFRYIHTYIYIIIGDNMNTFTHISLFLWATLGLFILFPPWVFFCHDLSSFSPHQLYQTISITNRERSWGDPVWGGREILNRNPVTHTHSPVHCISSISPSVPSTLTASLTNEASLPPLLTYFSSFLSLSPYSLHLFFLLPYSLIDPVWFESCL